MRRSVILDPAHGKDTPGKRSPDGLHREYLWSREMIAKIYNNIISECNGFDTFSPFLGHVNEPGLTARVLKYNDIAKDYDETFMLSIHNDAYGDGSGWTSPKGISVWTSRGEDNSDPFATSLYNYLRVHYPNDKFRPAYWLSEKEKNKDPDWEANFTVLAGTNKVKTMYNGVLLEWRFQTNKEEVKLLKNKVHKEYFIDKITEWIINTFKQ